MNNEMIELAREAVECDGWRWMRGIPAQGKLKGGKVGLVCLGPCGEYIADFYCLDYDEEWDDIHVDEQRELDILPDFDHPLAVHSLLVMVQEVWDRDLYTYREFGDWWVAGLPSFTGQATEIAALVAALKAGGDQ